MKYSIIEYQNRFGLVLGNKIVVPTIHSTLQGAIDELLHFITLDFTSLEHHKFLPIEQRIYKLSDINEIMQDLLNYKYKYKNVNSTSEFFYDNSFEDYVYDEFTSINIEDKDKIIYMLCIEPKNESIIPFGYLIQYSGDNIPDGWINVSGKSYKEVVDRFPKLRSIFKEEYDVRFFPKAAPFFGSI